MRAARMANTMGNAAKTPAAVSVDIADFKADPNAALKASGGEVVAVRENNRPRFYAIAPKTYEAMVDAIEDHALLAQAEARLNDGKTLVDVNLDGL